MQKKPFRAFFAIDLPGSIKKAVAPKIKLLSDCHVFKRIKWIKPDNLHLTLCFLGNITDEQYLNIDKKIRKATKDLYSFTVTLTDIQLFPSTRNPCALILKPEPSKPLKDLVCVINQEVKTCNIELEKREFKPHVTIGRIVNRRYNYHCEGCADEAIKKINFKVKTITLFKSEASIEGSSYTPVTVYKII